MKKKKQKTVSFKWRPSISIISTRRIIRPDGVVEYWGIHDNYRTDGSLESHKEFLNMLEIPAPPQKTFWQKIFNF